MTPMKPTRKIKQCRQALIWIKVKFFPTCVKLGVGTYPDRHKKWKVWSRSGSLAKRWRSITLTNPFGYYDTVFRTCLTWDADPAPHFKPNLTFHSNADPDPTFHLKRIRLFYADPDPPQSEPELLHCGLPGSSMSLHISRLFFMMCIRIRRIPQFSLMLFRIRNTVKTTLKLCKQEL